MATPSNPAKCSPQELERLREIEERWYDSHHSIIYTPPGQVPQTKGAQRNVEWVVEMLAGMKQHQPQGTKMMVVSSRCGEIDVSDADEWLEMLQVGMECAAENEAYIKAGVCSLCGACNLKEAESKCRPQPLGDTGDYCCPGEDLWREERTTEDPAEEPDAAPNPEP